MDLQNTKTRAWLLLLPLVGMILALLYSYIFPASLVTKVTTVIYCIFFAWTLVATIALAKSDIRAEERKMEADAKERARRDEEFWKAYNGMCNPPTQ